MFSLIQVIGVALMVLATSGTVKGEGVVERWARQYRGKMLSESKTSVRIGDSLENRDQIRVLDLQTGIYSELVLPDSISLLPNDEPLSRARLTGDGARVYYISERPFRGIWACDLLTGRSDLMYLCRAGKSCCLDVTPTLTPSGDTVWHSLSYVTLNDIGFDLDEESGRLSCLTSYRLVLWPDPDWSSSFARFPNCSKFQSGDLARGSWYEFTALDSADRRYVLSQVIVGSLPQGLHARILAASMHNMLFAVLTRGLDLSTSIAIYGLEGLRSQTRDNMPDKYQHLRVYSGRFSPDGQSFAVVASGSTTAILVSAFPKFDRFDVVCELPRLSVGDVQWSPDGEWLIAKATEIRGLGSNPYGKKYLVVIEVASREYANLPFPE